MRTLFSAIARHEVIPTSKAKRTFHMSRSRKWRSKESAASRQEVRAAAATAKMESKTDYSAWSQESLIDRVTQLEKELKEKNKSCFSPKPAEPPKKVYRKPRVERVFDPSKYNTRLVAFKLAYLGKRYNGFEHHTGNPTPLPTIEEELWKALNKSRLIFPKESHPLQPGEVNWEGTEYSKCGRTDKGVSAFGQVIGIRVRSNRPLGRRKVDEVAEVRNGEGHNDDIPETRSDSFNTFPRQGGIEISSPPLAPSRSSVEDVDREVINLEDPDYEEALNFDPVADEIAYVSLLNKVLPPDIRILAWCPFPPLDFSARFSCRERRYRYFFTQPAFSPIPHHLELSPLSSSEKVKVGWLDIDAMREAAKMYEGVHDFRNFCKVDGSKQISNFERRIFYADIEEVDDQSGALGYVDGSDFSPTTSKGGNPKVYTFTLHGSAFLWHQVRHMVAILFLVGQGLEKPSIVSELLDVEKNPRRPTYEMATDTPLVLWDCIFPKEGDPERKDAIQWLYAGDGPGNADTKFGSGGLMDDMWSTWRERKIDEMLAGTLMDVVSKQGGPIANLSIAESRKKKSQKVFDGGDVPRQQGFYTPVMKKLLLETPEVINEKYAVRKGFESAADMKAQGNAQRFKKLNEPAVEDADE